MRYGSLFAGYGGLELGVQSVLGGSTAWHCEIESAPSKILAHHWPDVPNLGDITKVDWSAVEPVDVLTGGFPCQDVSHAGKRLGLKPGTRSGLWSHMGYAIDQLRPRLVVAENVRGLLSADATATDGDLEPCAFCVGDGEGSPLRALGAVLGDLAELGYDAQWHGVRASDAGAPHGRFRVFVYAWPAQDTERLRRSPWRFAATGEAPSGRSSAVASGSDRVAEPSAVTLLPTPAVNDMGAAYTPETWDAWTATMQAKHGNGNGHGKSLNIEAQRLLPTPRALDATDVRGVTVNRTQASNARAGLTLTDVTVHQMSWGIYAAAIERWESLTRPAPAPTQVGKKGQPQLSPAFSEFMMGLPAGHVTDPAIGLTRNEQLKALGNGVVPQQAALATRLWLDTAAASPVGGEAA